MQKGMIIAITWSCKRNDVCFPLSCQEEGGDRLYHAVNAQSKRNKRGENSYLRGDGRRKTTRETSARAVRNHGGEDA